MTWMRHLAAFTELPFLHEQDYKPWKRPTVLVAGYGWATHAFVERISKKYYNVQVISERTCRLNQNTMIGSLAASYTPALVDVTKDSCLSVDLAAKRLDCIKCFYNYDYLVVATGSEAHDFDVPGVRTNCMMCKTDLDVEAIRRRADAGASAAIVLGGGPTGVELACSLYERGVADIQVVEGAATLLPGFSEAFRAAVAMNLAAKGIRVHLDSGIREVTSSGVVTKGGVLPFAPAATLVAWTCGVRPVEFVRHLGGDLKGGGLVVNDQLEYRPGVFVLGDACKNKGPATAQNAKQQGYYLADLFNSGFQDTKPYEFNELGRCLNLGDGHLIEVWGVLCFVPHIRWRDMAWIVSV
jgi:NADH dehydrogenase FAD-containing subunit